MSTPVLSEHPDYPQRMREAEVAYDAWAHEQGYDPVPRELPLCECRYGKACRDCTVARLLAGYRQ